MSLQTRLQDFITALGTDWKTIWANTGTKSSLTTTDKSTLVAAINEVNAKPAVDTSTVVLMTGAQTVAGVKTFSSSPVVPDGSFTIAKTTSLQTTLDAKAVIADASATNATTTTYSANKINAAISAAVATLVGSAGTTLDTLGEIATALGNDASLSATITTALGFRLKFDAAQTLTAPQKVQGNANLGSAALVDTGTLDTDLVALYTTAKA